MGKFLDKPYIQNPDSIQHSVSEIHMVSDIGTPTNVSNSLGVTSVLDTDFTWIDTSATRQRLQLNQIDIQATATGTRRHLVGWDGTAVVFATPVTEKAVENEAVYATPADLDVADITFNA